MAPSKICYHSSKGAYLEARTTAYILVLCGVARTHVKVTDYSQTNTYMYLTLQNNHRGS